ncbi:MAG: hemolysin family protein [Syntrophobacteraceae bacterium]
MFWIIIYLFILLFLILMNGFLAMSELAVMSSSKTRLQRRAEENNSNAGMALELARNPHRFLATVQIGITLIGVLSGAFGGGKLAASLAQRLSQVPYLAAYSRSIALALVVSIITYLSLLAELIPKRIAVYAPESIASAIAKPMAKLLILASPVIRVLNVSTDFGLRLFGFSQVKRAPLTQEEIRILLDQATAEGVFEEVEHDMVERVLRLGDRPVGAMMTPRNQIVWLDLNESTDKTRRKIARYPYSRFPVGHKAGNIQGVVHIRDLAVRCLAGKPFDLKAAMRKPIFVHEGVNGLKVLESFRQSGFQLAVVVDEYGTIEGVVTLTDILEAVVGDIASAELPEEPSIVAREENTWLVEGVLPVDELMAFLHIQKLPGVRAGLFRTLGGFIMSYLKRVPAVGDSLECCGFDFEVLEMEGRRVRKVLIKKIV